MGAMQQTRFAKALLQSLRNEGCKLSGLDNVIMQPPHGLHAICRHC